jgi:diguanylate cyclase (GGDEF)-like protein
MLVREKFTLLVTLVGLTAMATLAAIFHHNVDELGRRLESLYADALLPLHEAQKMESALNHVHYRVLEGLVGIKKEDAAVRLMQRRVTFQTGFNKFEKEFSVANQPEMQRLLARHGALQSQLTQEAAAVTEIRRDYPLAQAGLDEILDLAKSGKIDEALSRYGAASVLFDRLANATNVLIQLQVEQGLFASQENLAALSTAKKQLWIAVALLLVLGVSALYLVTTLLLRPFRLLEAGAEQVGKGNYSHSVQIKSADEFGRLATAFNGMSRELEESHRKQISYRAELEATVATRTAELERVKTGLEDAVAERTEQLNLTNAQLREQATELSRHNKEIALFDRSNELLQACASEAEACSIVSRMASELFQRDSGALYLTSASRNILEASATWGEAPPTNATFSPGDCWALRRGQSHIARSNEVRCAHVTETDCVSMCIPLIAQGETLGVLHILVDPAVKELAEHHLNEKSRLAKSLAEHVGLAIANLKLREAMRNMSVRDSLTGLYNRRYMDEALIQELHRARRSGEQVAVLMLDIDRFKTFNDSFGHKAGDAVLQELGRFLRSSTRAGDIACRYGGEEFAIILPSSTLEGGARRAEEIRQGVKLLTLVDDKRSLGEINVSLGVAIFPDHGTEPEKLLQAADSALYQAKRSGRDRVVLFGRGAAEASSTVTAAA